MRLIKQRNIINGTQIYTAGRHVDQKNELHLLINIRKRLVNRFID